MRTRTLVSLLSPLVLAACSAGSAAAQDDHDAAHGGPAMNFHRIGPQLATGGHYTDGGIEAIAGQGVTLVIDLRDRPPEGQAQRLAAAGIRWLNVPVVWDAPRKEDFEAFSKLMSEHADESILVQCQANYRASAMTYLYRVKVLGVPEEEARKDLNAVWTPEGTWLEFVQSILGT